MSDSASMSTLGKISKFLATSLMFLLLLSFALWGVGDVFRSSLMSNKAAEVGDSVIPLDEYQKAVSIESRRLEMQLGQPITKEMLDHYEVPAQTIAVLINQLLLKTETDRFGIRIGNDPVVKSIRQDEKFLNKEGTFDRPTFDRMLKTYGYHEKEFVEIVREDMERQLFLNAFAAVPPLTGGQAEVLYNVREQRRTSSVLTLGPKQLKDTPEPTAAELDAYYAKTKDMFATPELRKVSWLTFSTADIEHEMDFSDAALQTEYKFREDEFAAKEKRSLTQLIVQDAAKAKEVAALTANGLSLKDAAKKVGVSSDISEIGSLTRIDLASSGIIPKAVEDEIFSLEKNKATAPFQTALGWHIIEVGGIEPGKGIPFEQAKGRIKELMLADKGADLLYELSNRVDDKLAGGATLEETATELGLKKPLSVDGLVSDGKHPGEVALPAFGDFLVHAFSTEEGQVSEMVPDEKGGTYYVLHIDAVTPSRVRKLDEVREQVVAAWKNEQRTKLLKKLAEDTAKKLKDGATTLEQEAAALGAKIMPVGPIRRDFNDNTVLPQVAVKDMFLLAPGKTGVAWPHGDGFVILRADKVTPPDEKDRTLATAAISGELKEAAAQDIQEQMIIYLRSMHPVTQYVGK